MPSRASGLDAVTVDAFGTLVELVDPVEPLRAALAERGVARSTDDVQAAFRAEGSYYRSRLRAYRAGALAALRRDCARVFLAELEASLDPDEFAPAFVGALEFRLLPGGAGALAALARAGLALACVANWDESLHEHLARLGVASLFDAVVTSAEAGAAKPDPRIFGLALERLAVEADRALHIGDDAVDRDGAAAAGLRFEPPPLATLPERLGIR